MSKYRRPLLILGATSAALLLCSCEGHLEEAGPERKVPVSVEVGEATHANVQLDLHAGELKVSGDAAKLINGSFEFNVSSYQPQVKSSASGSYATVTIEQPRNIEFRNNARNEWDLQLNNDVVMDLTLNCGAGKARMELGNLNLRSLQVHMGAGEVDLDLHGHPRHDYDVDIAGGVGQATVHLPQGVGIRADLHGGLGSVNVDGLDKKGDHYENDMFDTAKVNVRLKVTGGIGEIRIIN